MASEVWCFWDVQLLAPEEVWKVEKWDDDQIETQLIDDNHNEISKKSNEMHSKLVAFLGNPNGFIANYVIKRCFEIGKLSFQMMAHKRMEEQETRERGREKERLIKWVRIVFSLKIYWIDVGRMLEDWVKLSNNRRHISHQSKDHTHTHTQFTCSSKLLL